MDENEQALLRKALLGAMFGAGTYGTIKLTKEVIDAIKGPVRPDNVLSINIPKHRLTKVSEDSSAPTNMQYLAGHAINNLLHGAAAPVSFGVGFGGMAMVYNALKQKQLDNEINAAEKKYLATLQKVKEKTAELNKIATPKTDELIINLLEKKAFGLRKFLSEARAITNFIGNGVATIVIAKSEKEFDEKMYHNEVSNKFLEE
jgi:hypothetical protein